MNRKQFEDFDGFLAAAEATGVWFGTGSVHKGCALGAYADERGITDQAIARVYAIAERLGMPYLTESGLAFRETAWCAIVAANDDSEGDPKVVRAKLHELYPEFASVPFCIARCSCC